MRRDEMIEQNGGAKWRREETREEGRDERRKRMISLDETRHELDNRRKTYDG